jgi:hypothetical protein
MSMAEPKPDAVDPRVVAFGLLALSALWVCGYAAYKHQSQQAEEAPAPAPAQAAAPSPAEPMPPAPATPPAL